MKLENIIKYGKKAIAITLTSTLIGLTTPYCGNGGGDGNGNGTTPTPTAQEYVEKWLPTNEVCLNYNEIVAMIQGETGIPSYVNELANEIKDCIGSINGPPCPFVPPNDPSLDLNDFSNGLISDCEFHNGYPRPFYLEKNIDVDNNGALEYNWDCPDPQLPIIFYIKQENTTNIYNYIKEFLILYVDKHKEIYDNLNLNYNPSWDGCLL